MPLTRNKWIEMWASAKQMETDLINFPIDRYSGPFIQQKQNVHVKSMLENVRFIKNQIESVLEEKE